jgi:putative FmdB family regulatory protein
VQFDRRQHFDDKPLTRCPECGKEALRKVYLPVGIVFKGSGFYATDHRSPSGQGTAKKPESKSEKPKKESEDVPSSTETSKDD